MEEYIVHEHSSYTSAIDKYWKFTDYSKALEFYIEMITGYIDNEEKEFDEFNNDIKKYKDTYEKYKDGLFYDLGEHNYIRLSKIF